ncbi:hypothetical protein [Pseudoalteromonas rubra]|uniref:Uncharacterized protein n=1 Tax=Pseudoalteromonas rubra TaxID=43658 RepID=A0A0U2Y6N0_9GAMM|nr:hypothetical protein [Pseudoalteromonas rubra]ALU45826.1 hypothetical protein AT705_23140 [Pseudoalteromonas rubra]
MLENQVVSQVILFLCSVAIVYIVSYAYLSGILAFARKGFKYEVLIVLGIPILLIPFIDYADFYTRRLIVLETVFNIFVLLLLFSHKINLGENVKRGLKLLFGGWFFLQVGGFIYAQYTKEVYLLMLNSFMLFVGILLFFKDTKGLSAKVTDSSRVLIFGVNEPKLLQVLYLFWISGVLLVEYNSYLPKVIVPILHLSSVVLAMKSGDFFHTRILTASHLMIINAKLLYLYDINYQGFYFARLPDFISVPHVVSFFTYFSLIGCTVTFALLLYSRTRKSQIDPSISNRGALEQPESN